MSAVSIGAFRSARREGGDPQRCSREMHRAVFDFGTGGFVTAIVGFWDPVASTLTWTNCGHLNPLLARGGAVRELTGETTFPLGIIERERSLPSATIELEPGDRLLIYSDGIVESRLQDGSRFGQHRLEHLLLESMDRPPSVAVAAIESAILDTTSGQIGDDATSCSSRSTDAGSQRGPRGVEDVDRERSDDGLQPGPVVGVGDRGAAAGVGREVIARARDEQRPGDGVAPVLQRDQRPGPVAADAQVGDDGLLEDALGCIELADDRAVVAGTDGEDRRGPAQPAARPGRRPIGPAPPALLQRVDLLRATSLAHEDVEAVAGADAGRAARARSPRRRGRSR